MQVETLSACVPIIFASSDQSLEQTNRDSVKQRKEKKWSFCFQRKFWKFKEGNSRSHQIVLIFKQHDVICFGLSSYTYAKSLRSVATLHKIEICVRLSEASLSHAWLWGPYSIAVLSVAKLFYYRQYGNRDTDEHPAQQAEAAKLCNASQTQTTNLSGRSRTYEERLHALSLSFTSHQK